MLRILIFSNTLSPLPQVSPAGGGTEKKRKSSFCKQLPTPLTQGEKCAIIGVWDGRVLACLFLPAHNQVKGA